MAENDRRIGPEWVLVAHDADTVEFRSGIWNSRTLTVHDDTGSAKLWPMVRLLAEGGAPKEVAKAVGVRAGEVHELLDSLSDLGLVSEGPRSALDVYLDQAIRVQGPEAGQQQRSVVLIGPALLARQVRDALDRSLEDSGFLAGPVRQLDDDEFFADLGTEILADSLELERVAERMAGLAGALVVAPSPRNDPIRYQLLDAVAARVGFPWVHATIDGPFVFVGPTVVPGESASYHDFEQRVSINLRERASYLKYKNAMAVATTGRPAPVLGPVSAMLAAHTALEALNFLVCGTNSTLNKVLTIYLPTMEIAYQEVLPLPGSTGGSIAGRDALSLYFDSREWLLDERVDSGAASNAATPHAAGR